MFIKQVKDFKGVTAKDVISYTGLSRSSIYEMINEDSKRYDPAYPTKAQLAQVGVGSK